MSRDTDADIALSISRQIDRQNYLVPINCLFGRRAAKLEEMSHVLRQSLSVYLQSAGSAADHGALYCDNIICIFSVQENFVIWK